jgi:hypothetical protein
MFISVSELAHLEKLLRHKHKIIISIFIQKISIMMVHFEFSTKKLVFR